MAASPRAGRRSAASHGRRSAFSSYKAALLGFVVFFGVVLALVARSPCKKGGKAHETGLSSPSFGVSDESASGSSPPEGE
jgi:hypothetical protein